MSEFDRGYVYGVVATAFVFLVWDIGAELLRRASQPSSTKLVVLDRRDMAENANNRTPDRMAGSGEIGTNP